MAHVIVVNKEGKGPGRPRTGIGPVVGVRLYPNMEAAINGWISRQAEPKPSRPEAIRRLVELGLSTNK
jgi:hypothetical protein